MAGVSAAESQSFLELCPCSLTQQWLQPASIVGVVGLLFVVPLLFGGDRYKLLRQIGNCLPLVAEGRLTVNPNSFTTMGKYPPSITGSWIVLGAWALVSVVVAVVVVRRRDV
ncbi:MAG: transporter permease [Streptomyces oryziradicis]|nr:transporter permease [Actinacidiphila oryziradicis]